MSKPDKPDNALEIAGVAHDLNNVFQLFIDAADQLSADPQWQPLADRLLQHVERGKQITAGLEQRAGARQVLLAEVVDRAITFVEDARATSVAAANGNGATHTAAIRFACDIDETIALRGPGSGESGGPWAWERVFINLFLNAMRAMPAGGTIEVRARQSGDQVTIEVGDEGTGIPAALLDHLFEPGVSGNASSGLGLPIARTILAQQGGTIHGTNRKGMPGAVFKILVPATVSAGQSKSAHAG